MGIGGVRPNQRMRLLNNPKGAPGSLKVAPKVPPEPSWRALFGSETADQRQLAKDARAQWRLVTVELDRVGLVGLLDAAILQDYATCWARLLQCERTISREGITAKSERGVVKHPAVTMANQLRAALKNYLTELALTPATRSRMDLPDPHPDEDDPWDV